MLPAYPSSRTTKLKFRVFDQGDGLFRPHGLTEHRAREHLTFTDFWLAVQLL